MQIFEDTDIGFFSSKMQKLVPHTVYTVIFVRSLPFALVTAAMTDGILHNTLHRVYNQMLRDNRLHLTCYPAPQHH